MAISRWNMMWVMLCSSTGFGAFHAVMKSPVETSSEQTGEALDEIVTLAGVDTKIYAAHFRLCHSRKPFVVAYFRESQEMVLDAFNCAFAFYGGVPRRVIIDNPKSCQGCAIGLSNQWRRWPLLARARSGYSPPAFRSSYEPLCCLAVIIVTQSNGNPMMTLHSRFWKRV